MKILLSLCLFLTTMAVQSAPIKLGVDGLSHGHVLWVFKHPHPETFDLVGIAEPDRALAERLSKRWGFSMDLVYPSLEAMVAAKKPQAVAAFNAVSEHLHTVQVCAPKGIHVMVEKPLAVNPAHAAEMARLARNHQIKLITNYETTWYPTHTRIYNLAQQDSLGSLRKAIITDGHKGPAEINVPPEFLSWLTDPEKNGGGAVTDFGCYGANVMTWLQEGKAPNRVYAQIKTFKPEVYPNVDDDALIVLEYDSMQAILLPSWNWAFSRKTLEVYGTKGYAEAKDSKTLAYRLERKKPEQTETLEPLAIDNAFDYFKAVIEETIQPAPHDLSSLENNLLVVQILDAAKRSAQVGKPVSIKPLPKK